MELYREPRIRLMTDTLVRAIIHIDEQRLPISRQRRVVNCIAVILGLGEGHGRQPEAGTGDEAHREHEAQDNGRSSDEALHDGRHQRHD